MKFKTDQHTATPEQVNDLLRARGLLLQTMMRQLALYARLAESGELETLASVVQRDAVSLSELLETTMH